MQSQGNLSLLKTKTHLNQKVSMTLHSECKSNHGMNMETLMEMMAIHAIKYRQ